MSVPPVLTHRPARLRTADCRLDDFATLVERATDPEQFPLAAEVVDRVLVYDAARLRAEVAGPDGEDTVAAELVRALTDGPGVVAIRGAFPDTSVVDRATAAFDAMIADERAVGGAKGDHFAKAGANDRVWNALEKLAVRDPGTFVDYYANDVVALVARAWLGPGYQVTSQVNVVRPGGQAQDPHRDYHLGFLENTVVEGYPAHVHLLSPVLTLQGAVAHSDMPVESGPTMYLPYSHQYVPGYLAWRLPEFRDHFASHHVQLALAKGDAAFFNPALFHGAGTNVSADIQRVANLLQVSSPFGRAMEAVDRDRVLRAIYPVLLERRAAGWSADALGHALAAAAEGYPFPTNLDLDQPVGGMTPASQAELAAEALATGVSPGDLDAVLDGYAARRTT
ncbi:phytanoyl-CoA dioxygenase family protein [Nocardioides cynanchi]|uniref:phytanoyl-CoA dioxygenase family protein n=1 Tax=Nocardioides cynanchi TaxID=2558918 RepID=UPI0012488563|nr:phytanoyl-CoA dioxygenase family protein [Nocardioides cynanchi]